MSWVAMVFAQPALAVSSRGEVRALAAWRLRDSGVSAVDIALDAGVSVKWVYQMRQHGARLVESFEWRDSEGGPRDWAAEMQAWFAEHPGDGFVRRRTG